MELCDKIKEIRNKFGLTQEGLAEKLNVSRQAVAKWEMGNGVPDTENLKTMSRLFGISIDTLLDNESDVSLMVLHQEINIKDYGKGITEQHKNLINKNFDDSWKVYVLTFDNKFGSAEDIVDTLTWGFSSITNVISAFKTSHYLAVKENYKLFVSISKKSIDIKSLNSNTNIKKFNLDNKTYFNFGEFKRI